MTDRNTPVGQVADRPSRITRRGFLRGAAVAAPLVLLSAPHKVFAAPAWNGHLEIGQKTGLWLKVPSGRANHIMVWPRDFAMFPPPAGWVSTDRTEVLLRDPGVYQYEWRLTMNPTMAKTVKTASQFWDGTAWRDWADGNQVAPSKGNNETTMLGQGWCVSDGTNRLRIGAYQDSGRDLTTSDRSYEAALHVWKTPS